MDIIKKYFPSLSPRQIEQFAQLDALYRDWNAKINVISRRDIDGLYEHHVLHSLGITQMIRFKAGTRILDFGTGGGFPGIPLAILFPECEFLLVDSIGKKVKVAGAVAEALGLTNVRAVMQLGELVGFTQRLIHHEHRNGMPNGLICLKGGELQAEIRPYKRIIEVQDLYPTFEEEYFKTKKVIYLPL